MTRIPRSYSIYTPCLFVIITKGISKKWARSKTRFCRMQGNRCETRATYFPKSYLQDQADLLFVHLILIIIYPKQLSKNGSSRETNPADSSAPRHRRLSPYSCINIFGLYFCFLISLSTRTLNLHTRQKALAFCTEAVH